jgi:hypothetical protein
MLFEMARALRSLTSPLTAALHEARRMARPPHLHFEEGGAVPHEGRVVDQNDDGDFLLPPDVDPMLVALDIDEKLRDGQAPPAGLGHDPTIVLERRAGGRIVVAGHHLLRLGDGRFDRGRQFMHNLIASIRRRH